MNGWLSAFLKFLAKVRYIDEAKHVIYLGFVRVIWSW